MKTLAELATVQTSAFTDLLPKVVSDVIAREIHEKAIGRSLCKEVRTLLKSGQKIWFFKMGTLTAGRVSEGADIESALGSQRATFTTVTVTPIKIGAYFVVTQEVIDDFDVDIVNLHLDELKKVIADEEDEYIFHQIMKAASTTLSTTLPANATTMSLVVDGTARPVLKVDRVSVAGSLTTDYSVRYWNDGAPQIKFGAATSSTVQASVHFWYTTLATSQIVEVATAGQLGYNDIVEAALKIRRNKIEPQVLVLYYDEYADLVKDERFIDKNKYGGDVMVTGEVGKIAGVRVVQSDKMFPGTALMLNRELAAVYVPKKPLYIKQKEEPAIDGVKFYFYERVGAGVIKEDAIAIITGAQSNAI